jgi:outer membrane protein assembly factor BamA
MRQSEKRLELFEKKRSAFLTTGYISYIYDTSIWDPVGPIDGTRANLTLGLTTNLPDFKAYNRLFLGDFRRYFRMAKYSCFAFRAFGFYSSGLEPQRIYLGGSWSLRGYNRRAFYERKVILFSNELRYPLINNLYISFPFGRVNLQAIRGALFFDAGNAWEDEFGNWNGSFGLGARIGLGYVIVLRLDVSRRTDFKTISKHTVVDFFFGWSF